MRGGHFFANSADAAASPPTCVMPQRQKNTDSPVKEIGFVVQWEGGQGGRGEAQNLGDLTSEMRLKESCKSVKYNTFNKVTGTTDRGI